VHVESARGLTADVTAHQTAPGRYEANLVVEAADGVTLAVAGVPETTRVVVPDLNDEYRLRPPDERGLKTIAEATGGVWQPAPNALANTGAHRAARRALWPALVIFALGLWIVDIWLRRVRLFEQSAANAGAAVRRSA
jgi:hypothetical protein